MDEIHKAEKYLSQRGEVYLQIPLDDFQGIQDIPSTVSIGAVFGNYVLAYANRIGFEDIVSRNIIFLVETPPSLATEIKMSEGEFPGENWNTYPTFEDYITIMHQFTDSFPAICRLDTIGFSLRNHEILVMKISDQVSVDEEEQDFFYTSTMHGDEPAGFVLLIRLISYILNQYGKNSKVTYLVDHLQIWINPLSNPDGTYFMDDQTISGAIRFNTNHVDLNRNFPDPEDGPHPDNQEYQPENIAMMNFMNSLHLVLSANIHGGYEVVNYPWDTWPELHPDDDWYQFVGRQYADTVYIYSDSYMLALDNGITNGFAWYTISGGRQDYVNYFLHGREVTLELSSQNIPPAEDLPQLWEYNYRSFINYMEQALFGITGIVTDCKTGNPVRSKIQIQEHDNRNSFVWSDSTTGRYYRMLKDGIYTFVASADGYHDTLIGNVLVSDFEARELNIKLSGISEIDQPVKDSISVKPNPFTTQLTISVWSEETGEIMISMFNTAGRMVITENKIALLKGENTIVLDGTNLNSGIYIIKIVRPSRTHAIRIVKIDRLWD